MLIDWKSSFLSHQAQYISFYSKLMNIYAIYKHQKLIEFCILSTELCKNEANKMLLFKIFTMGITRRHKEGTGRSHRVDKHNFSVSKNTYSTADGK